VRAFFNEVLIEGEPLNPVFAEDLLLSGKIVYIEPAFFLDAPWLVSKDFFDLFLDPEIRLRCGLYEIRAGEMELKLALNEVFDRSFSRSREWPPLGVDMTLQYLKRAFSRPAAGLAFWLRPQLAAEGACFTLGRRRDLFEMLSFKGYLPDWSFAVYEVIRNLFEDYDWSKANPVKPPFPPGELLRLAEKARAYLEFVRNSAVN